MVTTDFHEFDTAVSENVLEDILSAPDIFPCSPKTVSSPTYMVGFVLLLGYACCRGKFYSPKNYR